MTSDEAGSRAERRAIDELEEIYRSAPVGLCLVDAEFRFLRINEHLAAINGRPAADHIGKTIDEVMPQLADQILPRYQKVRDTGQAVESTEVHDRATGRTWLTSDRPLKDAAGRVTGIVTVVQEMTELERSQNEVRLGRERLRRAEQVARLGCWEWNLQTDAAWWSNEFFRIFGREPGSVEASFDVFIEHVVAEDRSRVRDQIDAIFQGAEPEPVEYRITDALGSERTLLGIATLRRDEEGDPWVLFGTTQDITEQRKRQAAWEAERAALVREREELEELLRVRTGALDRALDRLRRSRRR